MVALRDFVAVSNGSACSSARYGPSHVLRAMGLEADDRAGAMRFSWCHMTPTVDWQAVRQGLDVVSKNGSGVLISSILLLFLFRIFLICIKCFRTAFT